MSSFYYLRHGQTQANADGLMCGGDWDIPLIEAGRCQAETIASQFKAMNYPPTVLYVSPMIRAQQTAHAISRELALPMVTLHELREWKFGKWDRAPFDTVREKFLGKDDPEEGEPRADFTRRVEGVLGKVWASPGLPLVVGHGAFGLVVQALLKTTAIRMENCTPYRFEKDGSGLWSMRRLFE